MDSYRLGANQHIGRGISYQATADTGAGSAIYGDTGQYQVYVPDKVVDHEERRHGVGERRRITAAITMQARRRARRARRSTSPRPTSRRPPTTR